MNDFKMNNNAVVYAKYFSDRQSEQSIEGQIVISEYARKNNIQIIE